MTVVRKRLYPHGSGHKDVTLDWDTAGLSCDAARKSCASGFIKTPRMKIFSSEFSTIKVIILVDASNDKLCKSIANQYSMKMTSIA